MLQLITAAFIFYGGWWAVVWEIYEWTARNHSMLTRPVLRMKWYLLHR